MPIGSALGSIGSALIGSSAASSAADQQTAAEYAALNQQQQEFALAQQGLHPYMRTGRSALSTIANMYGLAGPGGTPGTGTTNFSAFTSSPDYQFAQQQGQQALDRTAAATGQLVSGGQLKAAQEFGQGLATQTFNQYYNRLSSLAGLGEGAASSLGGMAINAGNSMAGTLGNIGASQAAGTVGAGNAWSGALSALSGYGMMGRTGSSYTGGSLASYNPTNFSNTFSGGALGGMFGPNLFSGM